MSEGPRTGWPDEAMEGLVRYRPGIRQVPTLGEDRGDIYESDWVMLLLDVRLKCDV